MIDHETAAVEEFGEDGIGASFALSEREIPLAWSLTGQGAVAATITIQTTAGSTGSADESWTDLCGSEICLGGASRLEGRLLLLPPIGRFARFVVAGLTGSLKLSIGKVSTMEMST